MAKDRKEVFEQEERERTKMSQGCDNSIEGSEECQQEEEQECGIWSFWCFFG